MNLINLSLLIVIIILILISGFLSGSETAITATSKARIISKIKKGNKAAKYVKKIIVGTIIIPIILMSIARAVVKENRIEFFNEGDFKKCIP